MRVLSLEVSEYNVDIINPVSVYNVDITNPFFQNTFAQRGRGVNPLVEVTVNSKEENSEDFCPNYVQEFSLEWCAGIRAREGFWERTRM